MKTIAKMTVQPCFTAERIIARPRIADADYDVTHYYYDTGKIDHYTAPRADVHKVAAVGTTWGAQVFVE